MSLLPQYVVVVPAAGIGKRMQSEIPKQYLHIAGKTVIEHTLNNLLAHPQIKMAVVVLHPQDQIFSQLPIAQHPAIKTVIGGKERHHSVIAGLNYLPPSEEWGLVHDAARPCLAHTDLTALLRVAEQKCGGAILATPVTDTIKKAHPPLPGHLQTIKITEPREHLWRALTPQFFKLATLKRALLEAIDKDVPVTDEASAMEFAGEQVILVEGRASNIKITQPDDLLTAEFYLKQVVN